MDLLRKWFKRIAKGLGIFTYDYPQIGVTADILFFCNESPTEYAWELLLIKRKGEPYQDCWALPGGYVEYTETLMEAARRELYEETGIFLGKKTLDFEQMADTIGRDPRGRTITATFSIFHYGEKPTINAGDDAADAKWVKMKDLKDYDLAFDHYNIIREVFYGY